MEWLWILVPALIVLWAAWKLRTRTGTGTGAGPDLSGERDRRTGGFRGNNG